jgi:hypothetical protein
MTIHLEFPWEKKRREKALRELDRVLAEKGREANIQCNAAMMEPASPRAPCEYQGHDYKPVANSRKHVLMVCFRCCDPQRIPIHLPPIEVPRPKRCADLA